MAEKKEETKKERRPTAKKRDLQAEKRNFRNREFKSRVNGVIKDFKTAVEAKKYAKEIQKQLASVYSIMDKGVKTGILKQNKASRTKSRLSSQLTK